MIAVSVARRGRAVAPKRTAAEAGVAKAKALAALAAAALMALSLAGPARAQLFADNDARKAILELRAKVADVEKQLNDKSGELAALAMRADRIEAAQRAQLELANQIDDLKQQIAQLRGRIEELANSISTVQKRDRDLYSDLDARIKTLEPTSVTVDGKTATVGRGEQAAYDAALVVLKSGDFNLAATAFQQFLARYPQSIYAASAQYWLGSAYYAQKDFKNAVAAMQVVIDRFSDSPRAPDAMLNIAASDVELKDRKGAKAMLQRIVDEFPNSDAAKVAADRLSSLSSSK